VKKLYHSVFLLLIACSCQTRISDSSVSGGKTPDTSSLDHSVQPNQVAARSDSSKFDYFIINVPPDEFGYYIMVDGKMYIEQKTIPALQGIHGFASKEDAEKIAKLVIEKMKKGEIPPQVTEEELRNLKVAIKP
jgi:hypothetical protein